ncbi:MAG: hypothetical protein JNM26_13365, partial [Ideonella sp.]|nr:hypothetical protein [Ideonella sp.]
MRPAPSRPGDASKAQAPAWRSAAWIAALYAAVAAMFAGLWVAPGPVSPLFPAAGVALACVLVHRRAGLAGVLLGALAFHGAQAWWRGEPWLPALGYTVAAVAQAA